MMNVVVRFEVPPVPKKYRRAFLKMADTCGSTQVIPVIEEIGARWGMTLTKDMIHYQMAVCYTAEGRMYVFPNQVVTWYKMYSNYMWVFDRIMKLHNIDPREVENNIAVILSA